MAVRNGRLSTQSVAIYVGGLIVVIALIGLTAAYILAPEERHTMEFVTPVLTAVATILGLIFMYARQEATKETVEVVKESVDQVHKMVNSSATKMEEAGAIDRQRLEDFHRIAREAAEMAAKDATAATLKATEVSAEALERMIAVAIEAAFRAMPPGAAVPPLESVIPPKEDPT